MKRYRTPMIVSLAVGLLVIGAIAVTLWQAPRGVAQDQQPILEYPVYPPTPTVGPNPTTPPLPQGRAPLAVTAFDDAADLRAWEIVDLEFVLPESRSVWTIRDGRLAQDATAAAGNPSIQETLALTGEAAWTDYTVRVSFYDFYNGTAGLVARYSGADPATASYYRFRILKNTFEDTPKRVLEKVEGGVATTLAAIDEPGFTEREWHTLALSVNGGAITVTLDGQVVAQAQDPAPLKAGRAGIYTRAIGGIIFDDFAVVQP
ncbi:MAG: DUF1080 domain-containing protein [Oscillochloridaceae bacterium]|nr:DUF1080 domain-containing protein [Chloroflexaceae bacterium]MDW8390816.1 DUF1080 domain-containing protein [Oscillochloridaceae bacterium]